jgi:ATP-binding protein involved in chromosome partitioning
VTMFQKVNVPILGVVENMSGFVCPQCGHHEAIFGVDGAQREADDLGLAFLGRIPLEPGIRVAGDNGTPVVASHPASASAAAFTTIAERVAQRISILSLAPSDAAPSDAASPTTAQVSA